MVMAALSPGSVLATPIQANPQVKSDLQGSAPQIAQDAEKVAKKAQTDTITISAQALKMADEKDAEAREVSGKADEKEALQLALDKAADVRSENQKNALKAYASVSVG